MKWETPAFVEINMSAEIGAYQDDSGERDESPIAVPQDAPDPGALLHLSAQACNHKYNLTPADDRCVIEPGVTCNHCGYCLSHGH